jgi:phospholipid transport system substrate-binding protein
VRKFLAIMMVWLGLVAPAYADDAPKAQIFVDKVASDVLVLVQDEKIAVEDKKSKLNKVFIDVVDVAYVAKFVLGRHWRTATPAQQQAYLSAYGPFLINNYVARLTKYTGQTFKITGSQPTGDAYIVSTQLLDPKGPPILVDYRVRQDAGDVFKVIDIVVEGVSLLATQRSEFNSVVSNNGVDFLIQALQKKANG